MKPFGLCQFFRGNGSMSLLSHSTNRWGPSLTPVWIPSLPSRSFCSVLRSRTMTMTKGEWWSNTRCIILDGATGKLASVTWLFVPTVDLACSVLLVCCLFAGETSNLHVSFTDGVSCERSCQVYEMSVDPAIITCLLRSPSTHNTHAHFSLAARDQIR